MKINGMEFIYVEEKVIDESEFETHPVTDPVDGEGLTFGGDVKEEIDFDTELGMNSRRDIFDGESAIEDEKKEKIFNQDLESAKGVASSEKVGGTPFQIQS